MTESRSQETLIETGEGHVIALVAVGGRVHVDWLGPRHAELNVETARTLGYLLRGYARMVELSTDPKGNHHG